MKFLKCVTFIITILSSLGLFGQQFTFENNSFESVNTKHEILKMEGVSVLKLERDLTKSPFDINRMEESVDGPTFAKLTNFEMKNGTIEVKVLSKVQENSLFPAARGFIGLGFRIDQANKHFEGVYIRPSNGRADDQLRRNHSVQYFSYPDYHFARLRKEANGLYETYADIGLNEWIDLRVEIVEKQLTLYINHQKYPSFLVKEMLGQPSTGGIGLWVEIGTIGYFKDLKVTTNDLVR